MKKIEIYFIFIVCLMTFFVNAQLGEEDKSFNVKPKFLDLTPLALGGAKAYSIVPTTNGKYFASGQYGFQNSTKRFLIKFNKNHSIDTTFNVTFLGNNTHILDVAVQDDGKVIICGQISNVNGALARNVMRLNSDGTTDLSFQIGTGPMDYNGSPTTVRKIELLPNGKIAAIGPFSTYNGVSQRAITLLNSDGSVDLNFNPVFASMPILSGEISDVKFMNNVIGICGSFYMQFNQIIGGNSVQRTIGRFAVLNLDGSIPTTFTNTGLNGSLQSSTAMTTLNNQYFVCAKAGGNGLGAFDINGVESANFNYTPSNSIIGIPIIELQTLPDNSIVYLGHSVFNNNSCIGRVNSQGITDFNYYDEFGSFNATAIAIFDSLIMYNEAIPEPYNYSEGAGHLIFGYISIESGNLIQERSGNGVRGNSNYGSIKVLRMLPDGSFYAGGYFLRYNNLNSKGLVKVQKDGYFDHSLDVGSGFDGPIGLQELVEDVLVLSNGDLIVGGYFDNYNGANVQHIVKLNASGNLVPDFFQNYQFTSSGSVRKIKMYNNQIYILFTGAINYLPTNQIYTNIIRLNLDGSIDPTFVMNNGNANTGGFGNFTSIFDFGFQSSGDIIVAGHFAYFNAIGGEEWRNLIRIRPSGVLDTTFYDGQTFKYNNSETSSMIQVKCVNVLPDNTILFTGQFTQFDTLNCGGIVKLTSNGFIDSTFNSGIGFPIVYSQNSHYDISSFVQPDGKILFYGLSSRYYNNPVGYTSGTTLAHSRINSDGSIDATFACPENAWSNIHAVALQPSGSVIIGSNSDSQSLYYNTFEAPKFITRIFNDTNFVTGLASNLSVSGGDCNNFVATVNAYNGVQPYLYSWNGGVFSTNNLFSIDTTNFYSYQVKDSTGVIDESQIYVFRPESIVDFSTSLITSQFRSGFNNVIYLSTLNLGCVESDAQLMLVNNSPVVFSDVAPAPDIINGDTLKWNLNSTNYLDGQFSVVMNSYTPSSMQIGDSVYLDIQVISDFLDIDSTNNFKFYVFPVLNGYDPNDKKIYPLGDCIPNYILEERLTYTVRFQNTGNSEAINISVVDSLSDQFDMNTFRLIAYSHPVEVELVDSNVISFNFENINLPDSATSQLASQGYVVFEIFPKPNLIFGDEIANEANIYFDFNPPILTNEVLNTFSDGSHSFSEISIDLTGCDSIVLGNQIYYNPGQYLSHSTNTYGCDSLSILNLTINSSTESQFSLNGIDSVEYNGTYFTDNGLYEINMISESGCDSTLFISVLLGYTNIDNPSTQMIVIFPNPTDGNLEIKMNNFAANRCSISDVGGRIIMDIYLKPNYNLLDINALDSGIYFVNFIQDQKILMTKKVQKL